jgi:hypothetical protein
MVEWFKPIKCWEKSLFARESLKDIADKLGWALGYDIVEREMLYYDTMFCFLTYFPEELVFVGGSMINRIYIKRGIRFSFDLDTVTINPFSGKSMIVEKLILLNRALDEEGFSTPLKLGDIELRLGEVIIDTKKDIFPDVLSLKRIVPAMTFGTPISQYIRSRYGVDPGREPYASYISELRNSLGFMPMLEEVRIEVGISKKGFQDTVEAEVGSIIEPYARPKLRLKTRISSLESSISAKLKSLSRSFSEELLMDFVRDLCDLRMLTLKHDRKKLKSLVEDEKIDINAVLSNLSDIKSKGKHIYENSWHLSLVKESMSWEKLCSVVERGIERILADS